MSGLDVITMIERGATPYQLGRKLGDLALGIETYARVQANHYRRESVGASCIACDSRSDVGLMRYTWSAPADGNRTDRLGISLIVLSLGQAIPSCRPPVIFDTYHAICGRCRRRADFRAMVAPWIGIAGVLVAAAGCLGVAGGVVGLIVDGSRAAHLQAWFMLILSLAVFALGVRMWRGFQSLPVPPALRRIRRAPFVLDEVEMNVEEELPA